MFIALRDTSGASLGMISVGLGWDPAETSWDAGEFGEIDLNVAALMFSVDVLVDVVFHEQLNSADGAVRHNGDSITGEGRGDDEVVTVDLTRISPQVTKVLFLVTCYTGQLFSSIGNPFCRLIDSGSGVEMLRYDLSGLPHTGLVMGSLVRDEVGWGFEEINSAIEARHPVDAAPLLGQFLV
ncbi:TerD family protein [Nocardia jejuensis]|uniref:TerD family protein n=1 Tax=Nocardia jejuensis TaxID=328049 RepID=UPI000B1579BE|nr:TerD family protein [Nocardia jejuensis]